MSILLVTEIFPPLIGGSGRWFWEVYRRMAAGGVAVAAGVHPGAAEFDRTHELRVERLPLELGSWGVKDGRGLMGYARAIRGLLPMVRSAGADTVHCGRPLPEGLMGLALRKLTGVPFLCYAHGEELGYAAGSRELGWLTRRVLGRAECVIVNSRNTGQILEEEWGQAAGRIRLLHPGVDTGRFRPAPADPAARERLGWGDRRVVLTVGRLQRRKGQDMMIRALGEIRREVPDVLYAIVGAGEERGALEELVGAEGQGGYVQFLGELDDEAMVTCYQQCDLFALPNRQVGRDIEGFGMVLLEAQACGKPVVAGASGGTAETMRAGETGLVVPCETPGPLAEAVVGMLSDRDRLDRMGTAGRAWAVERFDWDAVAGRAERLFRGEAVDDDAMVEAVTA